MNATRLFWIGIAAIIVIGVWTTWSQPPKTIKPPARTFTATDFMWDDEISPYKDLIVASVNKIHREVEGCGEIDPTSAYLSEESTADAPRFFVTCGSLDSKPPRVFNVWFSADGIEKPRPQTDVRPRPTDVTAQPDRLLTHLWQAMHGAQATGVALESKPDLKRLLESMIGEQRYVCDVATTLRGMGPFERGRYARVRCLGDGAQHIYRVEMWAVGDTYTVRPWLEGIDDGRG